MPHLGATVVICFRDMTFCAASCVNRECHRLLTPEVKAAAERWWGKPGAPIAVANFANNCPDYQPEARDDHA